MRKHILNLIANALIKNGISYIRSPTMPGKPDFYFKQSRIALVLHFCSTQGGCKNCNPFSVESGDIDEARINKMIDKGISVFGLYECRILNNPDEAMKGILKYIKEKS